MKKMKQILLILLLMISLMFLYMLFFDNIETFSDYKNTDSSDNDISQNDLSGNDFYNRDDNGKKDDTNGKKDDTDGKKDDENGKKDDTNDNDKKKDPKPNDPYEKYFNQQSLIEEQGRFIDQQQEFIDMQNQNKNSNNPRNTCVNYLPSHYGEFQSDIQIGIIKLDTYWKFTTNPGVNAEYFPIIACQQPPITHAYENGSEYGYDASTPWSTIVQHSIIRGYPVPSVPC